MRNAFPGPAWLTAIPLALSLTVAAGTAQASVPTDFLTQQVCVSGGTVTNADPITCPTSRRHLNVGETLPYHKIDIEGLQISDSFPIADLAGVTKAVQTYFFTADLTTDPRFPNMVHFDAVHGGYNILGADQDNIFFRGTYDPAGGWQPWWTSGCQANGWLIAPNSSAAFTANSMSSPTAMYPSCPGTVLVAPSTVDWDYASFTYATSKQLDSIISTHFASDGSSGGDYGPAEVIYLTQEYGVTRWEAWGRQAPPNYAIVDTRCPNVTHSKTMRGNTYYILDCRDWSTVVTTNAPWDPTAHSTTRLSGEPNPSTGTPAMVWPVDPLYTGGNWLENTHIGGPYANNGSPSCSVSPWARVNSPAVLNWGWDSDDHSPFNTSPIAGSTPYAVTGNCTLMWSTPSAGGGQSLYQQIQIVPGGTGQMSFGAMMWARGATSAAPARVTMRLYQNDASGNVISNTDVFAYLSASPNTFEGSFTLNSSTKYLTLVFYPYEADTIYEMTGAWIAPRELILIPYAPERQ